MSTILIELTPKVLMRPHQAMVNSMPMEPQILFSGVCFNIKTGPMNSVWPVPENGEDRQGVNLGIVGKGAVLVLMSSVSGSLGGNYLSATLSIKTGVQIVSILRIPHKQDP